MLQPSSSRAAAILIGAARDLTSSRTVEDVAGCVRSVARALVAADGATFVLRDRDQCHYLDEDSVAPLWKGRRFPLTACISGWSMLQAKQAVIPDIRLDPRIPQDAYRPTFVRSLVMTPVRVPDPWAAIGVYWARLTLVTPDECGWLQQLADAASLAMELVRSRGPAVHDETAPLARMCAWTNRFFLDGEWVGVEEYLWRRFGARVSHTISEDALGNFGLGTPPAAGGQ